MKLKSWRLATSENTHSSATQQGRALVLEKFLRGGKNKKDGEENTSDFYILDRLVLSQNGLRFWLRKGLWQYSVKV